MCDILSGAGGKLCGRVPFQQGALSHNKHLSEEAEYLQHAPVWKVQATPQCLRLSSARPCLWRHVSAIEARTVLDH